MTFSNKIVTVFGGTGFLGRYVIGELAAEGMVIKVPTRAPEKAYHLRTAGTVGQIAPLACNIYDEASVHQAVKGSDYVVNCIGILYEKGKSKFNAVHTEFPSTLAKICREEGVSRFVHISALGIEESTADYARTKFQGEQRVLSSFPRATILRPSIVFGPEDNFFNMFAKLSYFVPAFPLIGGGKTKFQPVYVCDVAQAVRKCIVYTGLAEMDPAGAIYELGGPETLTFKEIYERLFNNTGRKRALIPVPWNIAKLQGSILGLLPSPLLTRDQVELLKTDNVVSENARTFEDLGINPTGMELVLPSYLVKYRRGGKFAQGEKAA